MKSANRIVEQAERLAGSVKTWADFSNALFNPVNGLITTAYPTPAERKSFMKTKAYRKIQQLLNTAIDAHGLIEGATPKKSGRFFAINGSAPAPRSRWRRRP